MKKPSRKSIKTKLDKVFSLLIRARGKCERCNRTDGFLQCSHIYSRANLSVRWDELNATCSCSNCHFRWHQNPLEGMEWLAGYYGPEKLAELRRRANEIKKWTIPELSGLLAELETKLSSTSSLAH